MGLILFGGFYLASLSAGGSLTEGTLTNYVGQAAERFYGGKPLQKVMLTKNISITKKLLSAAPPAARKAVTETKCSEQTDQCEPYDASKIDCKVLEKGAVAFTDGFGQKLIFSVQCYDYNTLKNFNCVGKEFITKEIDCPAGMECDFKTSSCMKVDKGLISCKGPSGPHSIIKEKVEATDKFGVTSMGEDACVESAYTSGPFLNQIQEYWCDEDKEMKTGLFDCPTGMTYQNGACVQKEAPVPVPIPSKS